MSLRREELERSDRPRARARSTARRARADVRRPLRDDARRDEPRRRLVLARAAVRLRADRRGIRPRRCSRRSASCMRMHSPRSRPARRTTSRTRSCASTARPSSSSSPRRRRPSLSTQSTRSRRRASPACSRRTRHSTVRVRRLRELGAGQNGRVPAVTLEARRVAARTSPSRECVRRDAGDANEAHPRE